MKFNFYLIIMCVNFLLFLTIPGYGMLSDLEVNPTTKAILSYGIQNIRAIKKFQKGSMNILKKLDKFNANNHKLIEIIQNIERTKNKYPSDDIKNKIDDTYNRLRYIANDKNESISYFADTIIGPSQRKSFYHKLFCRVLKCNKRKNPSVMYRLNQHYQKMISTNMNTSTKLKLWDEYIVGFYNSVLLMAFKWYHLILICFHYAASPSKRGLSISFVHYNLIESKSYDRVRKNVISELRSLITTLTTEVNPILVKPVKFKRKDPEYHKEGVTYGKLSHFLRYYESNQKYFDLNEKCTKPCSNFSHTQHASLSSTKLSNEEIICDGRIHSCKETIPKKYCKTGQCCDVDGLYVPDDIYSGCKICACTCDEIHSRQSIRYVNVKSLVAHHPKGYVVTGIRFIIKNRVISLQIQEGLFKNNVIDPKTVHWIKINDFNPNDRNNSDIVKLRYKQRMFALDDLILPIDSVVIGVKFVVYNGIIKLKIRGLNMKPSGEIFPSQRKTLVSFNRETQRSEINTNGTMIPTLSSFKNTQFSKPNKFLMKFKQSILSINHDNYVVPFIDLQPVETDPPMPIIGVGIHLRYQDKSGGFLAPSLISHYNSRKKSSHYINMTVASFKKTSSSFSF